VGALVGTLFVLLGLLVVVMFELVVDLGGSV